MLFHFFLICVIINNNLFFGDGFTRADFPYYNVSLSWAERVDDLVSRLTFEEIVLQLSHGGTGPGSGPAPAVERLGIIPYGWNTECLRGDVDAGPATSFPQSIGLAATFSKDIVFRMAEATAIEVRAKFVDYIRKKQYGDHKGLSCFSPVINIMRHPLWGRNQETYGEDPFLTSEFARSFVHGLQGNHDRFVRANAGCKHYAAHSGPENLAGYRFTFDAKVSQRDLMLTYLPHFKACVEAGAYSVMCSYNSINGIPSCANNELLTKILRDEWGFTGYVVSDQDAVRNIWAMHHYLPDMATTAAAAIKAGCNLELCTSDPNNTFLQIPTAVAKGLLDKQMVIDAVKPLFYARFRLGEFDPPEDNPFIKPTVDDVVQSDDHRALSVESAQKSFVLLKNDNETLPLKRHLYNVISLVGPFADNPLQLFGDYSAEYDPKYTSTPYNGLKNLSNKTNLAQGCDDTHCNSYNSSEIISSLADAEIIFVCLGTGQDVESEGNDRPDMKLPGKQRMLLEDVIAENEGKVPVILLLFNAGPLELDPSFANSVQAILECFFPAQATGEAIRNVLLNNGDFGNPAGRLPYTWLKSIDQAPNMTDYSLHNRTYRYWDQGSPSFPFGYGLSYTKFKYSSLKVTPEIEIEQAVKVEATVTNIGMLDGDEVIQVYISWKNVTVEMPKLQLVSFERTRILAGSSYVFSVLIPPERMAIYEDNNGFVVRPGTIMVYVGGQQPNQEVSVGSNVLASEFVIHK